MALLPYLLESERPCRIRNQLFGLDFSPDDLLDDIFDQPLIPVRKCLRPWKNLTAVARDVGSRIKNDKSKFQVNLDVQHFDPEEISVKTRDGYVVIEGKHEERKDEHGYISRHFKRRYALPEGCDINAVESRLSSDGVLTVTAPKVAGDKYERCVPITHTGPVKRTLEDAAKVELEEEEKSLQKKQKR